MSQVTGHKLHINKGFTIVETVVALGVFAFAVTSIIGVFLAIIKIDRKGRAIRTVEQNARFLAEFIEREGRNGLIDYASYGCPANCGQIPIWPSYVNELRLINAVGESERIYLSGTTVRLEKGGLDTPLTGTDVSVSRLNFYINPKVDPFLFAAIDKQPETAFNFTLQSNISGVRPEDRAVATIQNTFSIRHYPRP